MLPKPEKPSKKKLISESEELPKVPDPEIKLAAIRKKRLMIGIGLGFTVVLSISFSAYRFFKTNSFSLPKIKTPNIEINIKQPSSLKEVLDKELLSENHTWSIDIVDSTKEEVIKYSNSNNYLDYVFTEPSLTQFTSNQSIQQELPGGVLVKYYSDNSSSDSSIFVYLQNPQKEINIKIRILEAQSYRTEDLQQKISIITKKIYWYLVSN